MGTSWSGYELVVGTSWSRYELVLGTSWLGYELAWYDLVRVRVDWKPARETDRWNAVSMTVANNAHTIHMYATTLKDIVTLNYFLR